MAPTPPETDREGLVALYNATGGPTWNHSSNWLSDVPISQWEGVATDNNGRVISLRLSGNQLRGELPPELGSLANLSFLYLNENQLSGKIPPELSSLVNLSRLRLSGNQLSGEIPPELGNLNLAWLYLNENQLSGEIPPELGSLANLTHLHLTGNQLSGEIPPELGSLADLGYLYLNGNQLSGCVPSSLSGRLNMKYSELGGLPFCPTATAEPTPTATAEPTMAPTPPETDRETLVALYNATGGPNWRSNNNWLSDVPISQWEGVTTDDNGRVTALALLLNQLRGELPPELGNLANLSFLYLNENQLSGEIPPELGSLVNLSRPAPSAGTS